MGCSLTTTALALRTARSLNRFTAIGVVVAMSACGDPPATVSLQPVLAGSDCYRAMEGRVLLVSALGEFGEVTKAISLGPERKPIEISDFPSGTEQFALEVIGSGGAAIAAGKSAPIAFAQVQGAVQLPIYLAPINTVCAGPLLTTERVRPLIAAAGDGALIVGGENQTSGQLSAEYFDPISNQFSAVELPSAIGFASSLQGSALVSLANGDAVLFAGGTGAYAVFESATRQFSRPKVFDQRNFFAAAAVGPNTVAIAGGCRNSVAAGCVGDAANAVLVVDVLSETVESIGNLTSDHIAPTLIASANNDAVIVVGGKTLAGLASQQAERVTLATGANVSIAVGGVAVGLQSGALVTGYASQGIASSPAVNLVTPALLVRSVVDDVARTGPGLLTTEAGELIAFGGGAALRRIDLSRSRTNAIAGTPLPAVGVSGTRLRDGSILVVGGNPAAASTMRMRPPLVGPSSPSLVVAGSQNEAIMVPSDPSATPFTGNEFELRNVAEQVSGLLWFGGIEKSAATVQVTANGSGGLAVAFGTSPDDLIVVELVPASPAVVVRQTRTSREVLCTATLITAPFNASTVTVTKQGQQLTMSQNGQKLLSCERDVFARKTGIALGGLAVGAQPALLRIPFASIGPANQP